MRKNEGKFITKFFSEIGTKERNNDYFGYVESDNVVIWVIADGYGDENNGGIASRKVVEKIIEHFILNPEFSNKKLEDVINYAHFYIRKKQIELNLEGLIQSSVFVLISDYNSYLYGSVGNCRFYHLRNGYIIKSSKDDTISQSLVDEGYLQEENLKDHRQRNDLLQCIGDSSNIKINMLKKSVELQIEDKLILSTLGFWENIDKKTLEKEIINNKNSEDLIKKLKGKIQFSKKNDIDNNTFVIINIEKVAQKDNKNLDKKRQKNKIIMLIISLFLMVLLLNIYFLIINNKVNERVKIYNNEINTEIKEKNFNSVEEKLNLKEIEYRKLKKFSKNIIGFLSNGSKRNERANTEIYKIKEELKKLSKIKEAFMSVNKANEYFKEENYEDALFYYERAKYFFEENDYKKEELNTVEILKILNERIKLIKEIQKAQNMENEGNVAEEVNNFKKMKEYYGNAKDIYIKNTMEYQTKKIEDKIKEIKEREKSLYNSAVAKENQGSIYFLSNLIKAREEYVGAKEIYNSLGDEIKVNELENKIGEINSKIVIEEEKAKIKLADALKTIMYKDPVEGIEKLMEIKEIYRTIGDIKGIDNVNNFIEKSKDYIKFDEKNKKILEEREREIKDEREKNEELLKVLRNQKEEEKIRDSVYLKENEGDWEYKNRNYKEALLKYEVAMEEMEKIKMQQSIKNRIMEKYRRAMEKNNKKWWEFWK